MLPQRVDQHVRQDGRSILAALAAADDELAAVELHILDAQRERLAQTQARAIEQAGDRPVLALQV
jgi:hypothetical protein